uniref:DNA-directed RNA polymerase subunit beta'' n=1 Tax=Cerataulina bicornis TaxID=1527800 RepID=A0A089VPS9_CERBC|nr:RNA polymerase beta' subunit [Cerataulina daemon]AIR75953.1 RNA polymerase beta' subunit [Cerataulina daemon]
MKNYTYQNSLISKKQLKQLLAWSFTRYDSMQACLLADELKYLGFKYATQAGISISIEDLKVPSVKNLLLTKAHQEIVNAEKICLKGKITDVERFQKIIDTWSITSESLKDEVVSYFKKYDPLNSVYIMAFSGARGNLSQVRQLVGMRGLMSDPHGEILKLPIKKNFREGLTITDYLMSGYGARKGIVDTALKTANSGYLTRRLIDVSQDIIIREKDCQTTYSCLIFNLETKTQTIKVIYDQILGRLLSKTIYDPDTNVLIAKADTQITPNLIRTFKQKNIKKFFIRSPLTCRLYRSICQKCYGWDLANENLVDIGEAIGIIAGQSIGEPGTQLTMRTFHTGGIFTSEARQQIISPINGIVKFSKILKTIILRTNRGEDVLLTKNSGSLIIIPENSTDDLIKLELIRNTILFNKNNQYVKTGAIIGELANSEKQIRTEIKPVLSTSSGEIFMPRLKNKRNFVNRNKLLWILSGKVYQTPLTSFLNFYTDHKINKNSYIFRTKLINHYPGIVSFVNNKTNLFERQIEISNLIASLEKSQIQKLFLTETNCLYVLTIKTSNYFINLINQDSRYFLNSLATNYFATLISNDYKTQIGGIPYYDQRIKYRSLKYNQLVSFVKPAFVNGIVKINKQENPKLLKINLYETFKVPFTYTSIIWLPEETYKLNCDRSMLLVEHGNFISKNYEIVPGIFSKTSGIVIISSRNNIVSEISIKAGLVYQGKHFDTFANKIFYPGEEIFDNIILTKPSLCQHISSKGNDQLLIRPLNIFEVPRTKPLKTLTTFETKCKSLCSFTNTTQYVFKSNQKIKTANSISLIENSLFVSPKTVSKNQLSLEFKNNHLKQKLNILVSERIYLNNYIPAHLRYTNLNSCVLIQSNQFIDAYTTLGYLETVTPLSLEIVKFKSKVNKIKQVLLISNEDCITLRKEKLKQKTINDLVINNVQVNQTGKIIIDNGEFLTIQKGRPYFFPNCQDEKSNINTPLAYKLISPKLAPLSKDKNSNRDIYLNYFDLTKQIITKKLKYDPDSKTFTGTKMEYSKMFIKKYGKLYSSPIPIFINNFLIQKKSNKFENIPLVKNLPKGRKHVSLFLKNSQLFSNSFKQNSNQNFDLTRIKFFEYPFKKSINIHSISEDFFERDVNSVFCKNGEFVENGQTIGLLNFEKEITGDIVQGLPRIEELLEARKKKRTSKHIPTNQKKGLLINQTSLDPSFEFRKLASTVKENERINPHSLLKVYFNYYGLIKHFFCDQQKIVNSYRLTNNYEASYRSFKKVQSLILNSVQSVYESQGVSIADKHLEVIIKQMTTKVLITHEGNTPLLPREVIDLYHIQYINEIIMVHKKQPAFYVPLLLGITKAALNNPSFISAASFQETTRVLTKAAIEGRVDWLRGLKENIIIGHLIPAGTGSQNYINCFTKKGSTNNSLTVSANQYQKL